MQDVEVTGVTKLEGSRYWEGIHPGEGCIKEVAGDVETLIAPSQLHQVTAGAGEENKGQLNHYNIYWGVFFRQC